MALSTDYALRTGAFDPADRKLEHCGIEGMSCECQVTNQIAIRVCISSDSICIHECIYVYCDIISYPFNNIVEELKARSSKRYHALKVCIHVHV